MIDKAKSLALNAHSSTNHYYDTYLPYEFHLRMVVKAANDFIDLVPVDKHADVISACWLHDTIEDTRTNYNDVKRATSYDCAEIVRACTNYTRGRNRDERMPIECYNDIAKTPYALFVKMCDRIANVQYSKMTGSRMFEMYRVDQLKFKHLLYNKGILEPMWDYLDNLFD